MRRSTLAIGCLFAAAPAPALGDSVVNLLSPHRQILGVTLGQPLSVQECATEEVVRGYRMYAPSVLHPPAQTCFKRLYTPDSQLDLQNGKVALYFADVPRGFQDDLSIVRLVDGNVESMTLYTYGLNVQDAVLEALTEKFGRATSTKVEKWQNRMGATFDGVEALWKFTDLSVSFTGIGSKIDTGYVVIETRAGERAEADEQAKKRAAETKL